MPRDSNGNYTLPDGYLAQTGQTIEASQHNPPLEDLGAAMTGSVPRNGSAPMNANLPMGGFRITGMADGSGQKDAVTVGQAGNVVATSTASATVKNTPVDEDSIPLSDSANGGILRKLTWARVKAVLATVLVPQTRTVTGAGLAAGGGDLSEDQEITVNVATQAEAEAGTINTKAMTPLRTRQALDDNVYSGTNTNNTNFPIGTILIASGATGLARNTRLNVFLASDNVRYVTNASGAGAQLTGEWNKLCLVDGGEATILVQRVS